MYVTVRSTPPSQGLQTVTTPTESVAAVLPLYITAMLGMGPLAYGFIDGIHQGMSALVRIFGGWWADTTQRPKWVAFVGYLASAASRAREGVEGTISDVWSIPADGTGPPQIFLTQASPPAVVNS